MVVDDEPDTVDLIKLVLETEGFEVVSAYSGRECLEKLDVEKPAAVLLDIMMPEMDGWEVFHRIKEKYKDLPVAILTVRDKDIDKMLGLHVLKADDYITKPFGRQELIDRVNKIIKSVEDMEKVTFKTKEGVTIVGNYFKSQKHAPAFLLLHMMPSTKESWDTFASFLQKQGFAVLAIDLRGHGESIDKNGKKLDYREFSNEEHRESMNDIASAKEFLEQKGTDISKLAIAGASIGANLALKQASVDNAVRLLVLLSAGIDYRGIRTPELATKYAGSVYIAASEGDTYAAESSRKLYGMFTGDKKLKIIKSKSHGTDMLVPELIDEIIQWIVDRLK